MSKYKCFKPVLILCQLLWLIVIIVINQGYISCAQALFPYLRPDNRTVHVLNGLPVGQKYRRQRQLHSATNSVPNIFGFRAEADSRDQWTDLDNGMTFVKAQSTVDLRLFGTGLNGTTFSLGVTKGPPIPHESALCSPQKQFAVQPVDSLSAIVPVTISEEGLYYLCYSYTNPTSAKQTELFYYLNGAGDPHNQLMVEGPLIPFWVQIFLILLLLCMSGLFSGLNLGLMALDKNELKVIERAGTTQEKQYAKQISPVRKRGNYLLCTLLLGNVLVNSTLTIFLDALTSGIVAVIASTFSIVIFGEIIPQALCSRHGLAVGARTVWITYLFMIVTFPLSFPISKILDKVLGEEIGKVYDRERLMEYIYVTKDYNRLDADEVNIISGALKLSKIKVIEIMTHIQDVFMLPYDSLLTRETVTRIDQEGFSRVPIYEGDRNNVVGILHAKDLAFTDPDQKVPIKTLIEFYKHPIYFVYEDVTLDVMLNEFKQGKSHMAFVRKIVDDGENDPYYELAGVLTLEDVIEELIQAEINDETDVISDNRRKQKRRASKRPNFLDFNNPVVNSTETIIE